MGKRKRRAQQLEVADGRLDEGARDLAVGNHAAPNKAKRRHRRQPAPSINNYHNGSAPSLLVEDGAPRRRNRSHTDAVGKVQTKREPSREADALLNTEPEDSRSPKAARAAETEHVQNGPQTVPGINGLSPHSAGHETHRRHHLMAVQADNPQPLRTAAAEGEGREPSGRLEHSSMQKPLEAIPHSQGDSSDESLGRAGSFSLASRKRRLATNSYHPPPAPKHNHNHTAGNTSARPQPGAEGHTTSLPACNGEGPLLGNGSARGTAPGGGMVSEGGRARGDSNGGEGVRGMGRSYSNGVRLAEAQATHSSRAPANGEDRGTTLDNGGGLRREDGERNGDCASARPDGQPHKRRKKKKRLLAMEGGDGPGAAVEDVGQPHGADNGLARPPGADGTAVPQTQKSPLPGQVQRRRGAGAAENMQNAAQEAGEEMEGELQVPQETGGTCGAVIQNQPEPRSPLPRRAAKRGREASEPHHLYVPCISDFPACISCPSLVPPSCRCRASGKLLQCWLHVTGRIPSCAGTVF